MNKTHRTICCVIGAVIGMIINTYFNKDTKAFDFALAAMVGAGVTNWIIGWCD